MDKKIECFVIMPIGDEKIDPESFSHFNGVYNDVIKASIEYVEKQLGCSITCSRADDIRKSGNVMKQVLQSLADKFIVIADLSDRNPNVFYELGIRHTFFKRSILITDSPGKNPFDVHGYRTVPYKYPNTDLDSFNKDMLGHIKEILDAPTKSDNPVWDYNLKPETLDAGSNVKVEVSYEKIDINADRHDYEFEFGVTNLMKKAIKNITADLTFPAEYLERNDWDYPHLKSKIIYENDLEYIHFTFNYMGLEERIRRTTYDTCLLPGKTLWIFGKEPSITRLPYYVTHKSWDNRHKHRVKWIVYVDGEIMLEGNIPFTSLEMF